MAEKETKLDSELIYNGKIVRLRKDKVLCANGNTSYREIVDHHGGVGIVAFKDNKMILVKQFRYAYNEFLYEIPAGKLEKDESPLEAGKRELLEETGYESHNFIYLGKIYPSCGYTNEIIHLYLASNLIKKDQHLDDDESIDLVYFDIEEVKEMINKGIIKDAKTICALYYYLNR